MKTIIVINDYSTEARHAAELALNIAQKVNANLLLANAVKINQYIRRDEYVLVTENKDNQEIDPVFNLVDHLKAIETPPDLFSPEILDMDIIGFCEKDLIQFIIKNDIWMIVKGLAEGTEIPSENLPLNIQTVLNRIKCPLLLVPVKFQVKDFERIVYMADLRYCRLQIVRYLAKLAVPYHASLMVAHLSAKGLPHIEENYANTLFDETVSRTVNYDLLHFNNVKERNPQKALDIMINGMGTDLLALVHHRFHFEEIMGRYITDALPVHITIPVLIFPY